MTCRPAVLAAAGCGGADGEADRPPRLPVTGTVTYNGAPLADAQITFNPETAGGTAAFARTDAEGHYELTSFETGDGGHTHKHGGALLPESLRWLWRDFPK